ncbi:MAG TPA: DUF305 domain-containing protein [Hydrogenophaga sp.]|uniref:DUF305 domain-containing protein n=1 Tax=Hydrogenophaga sp. TaxID=1904254 RepID=UPI002C6A15FF|nr:DUF305 domain-containing protein [Hydrogenophaga sp.]HSX92865.1 DUF305 domain-containing protein [Hydrogenophaga sp.]
MQAHDKHPPSGHYLGLLAELAIDFVVMYFVMYTMIATVQHLRLNLNNVYMTLMMVAPMAVVMMVFMRSMFPNRRANLVAVAVAAAVFVASFAAMRTQAGIGDREFLRSMIPHHSGAILMCQEAQITDPRIVALCQEIVKSQTEEIARMEAMLQ